MGESCFHEMAIEIGGMNGINIVWRNDTEREHCVGAKKKQGPRVMCWGMIGWNYKGEPETKKKKAVARSARRLPKASEDTSTRRNTA